ncbi:MAG: hypothetical protein GY941_19845 [Planctomycetes bacterium]|nr:hypothetical protein [Planctomycetota bacterium]
MALIVEDGTGVANADTYISGVDALAFLTARGFSLNDELIVEQRLLQAMDVLNIQLYHGTKTDSDNSLPHPRRYLTSIEGVFYASDEIAQALIEAQIWLAYYIDTGVDLGAVSTPAIKREKVDVLETEYAVDTGVTANTELQDLPFVFNFLKHMLKSVSNDSSSIAVR